MSRRREWQSAASLALSLGASSAFILRAVEEVQREQENILLMQQRTESVRCIAFNLNSLTDNQLFTDFRFKLS